MYSSLTTREGGTQLVSVGEGGGGCTRGKRASSFGIIEQRSKVKEVL